MTTDTIAFIGGGNMASAIIGGLIRQGLPPAQISVVEPFAQARQALLEQHGVQATEAADASLADAQVLVWAVKPQNFAEAATRVQVHLKGELLQLSVMAGIRSTAMAEATGQDRIVRAMPNTPARVGQGVTAISSGTHVTDDHLAEVGEILGAVGGVITVAEKYQDSVTAVSGSGPAYLFLVAEALIEGGVHVGLPRDVARELAVQTLHGSATLLRDTGDHPTLLREAVTSPGGTTAAALRALEDHGVRAAFLAAVEAARDRSLELG